MMPGIDGIILCTKIREQVDCPILFVTSKTGEADLMRGFGAGGDDYITKPFGIGELRARVAAHLRRESREKKRAVTVNGVQFYLQSRKMVYEENEIALTKSEYDICEYLALNHGQVFSSASDPVSISQPDYSQFLHNTLPFPTPFVSVTKPLLHHQSPKY